MRLYFFLATAAVLATACHLLVPLLKAPRFPPLLFPFIKAPKHVKDFRVHVKEQDCKGIRCSFSAYQNKGMHLVRALAEEEGNKIVLSTLCTFRLCAWGPLKEAAA